MYPYSQEGAATLPRQASRKEATHLANAPPGWVSTVHLEDVLFGLAPELRPFDAVVELTFKEDLDPKLFDPASDIVVFNLELAAEISGPDSTPGLGPRHQLEFNLSREGAGIVTEGATRTVGCAVYSLIRITIQCLGRLRMYRGKG